MYRERLVRDLDWCIHSQPLLRPTAPHLAPLDPDWLAGCVPQGRRLLAALDRDPAPLQRCIGGSADRRLGRYFEDLLAFWFDAAPGIELIARNLRIDVRQRTLGEFDFLLRDRRRDRCLHLEVAVKFYLGGGALESPGNWVGPNVDDRFDTKLHRILERQSRLALDARVGRWLAARGLRVDTRAVLLKGRAFYPFDADTATGLFAAGHERGWWAPIAMAAGMEWASGCRCVELPRRAWLAALAAPDVATLQPFAPSDSVALNRPVCVAWLRGGRELGRGFLVPTGWEGPVAAD